MVNHNRHLDQSGSTAHPPRIYSPDLKTHLQSILSILADIDAEFERERARISLSTRDLNGRISLLEELRLQHRKRREPYLMQLAIFQECIRQVWPWTADLYSKAHLMTDEEVEVVAEELAKIISISWPPGYEKSPFVRVVTDSHRVEARMVIAALERIRLGRDHLAYEPPQRHIPQVT